MFGRNKFDLFGDEFEANWIVFGHLKSNEPLLRDEDDRLVLLSEKLSTWMGLVEMTPR